jgi:hypothetical protein
VLRPSVKHDQGLALPGLGEVHAQPARLDVDEAVLDAVEVGERLLHAAAQSKDTISTRSRLVPWRLLS